MQSLLCWPEEKITAGKESTNETVLEVNSFIGRYHEYQEIWTPEIGDEYELKREPLDTVDHNAVAIVHKREGGRSGRKCIHQNELNGETVLEHVPWDRAYSPIACKISQEAKKQRKSCCERQACNRGAGYGLEIPCEYCFTGDKFSS